MGSGHCPAEAHYPKAPGWVYRRVFRRCTPSAPRFHLLGLASFRFSLALFALATRLDQPVFVSPVVVWA